jgi:hypothetical protein
MNLPMTKPNHVFTPTSTSTQPHYPGQIHDPSMKSINFNQLLQNRGIRFMHSKAVPCPNDNTLDDNSHSPMCQFCDGSGIIYYQSKEIIGAFISNSLEKQFEYNGEWESGNAICTFPTEYSDGTQAEFGMYDRLQVLDYTARLFEKKTYEPRTGNLQQLRYPIEKVDYLITVTDSTLKEYIQGTDFNISSGKIQWVTGHTPSYDNLIGQGQIYSVSYYANPVFIVLQPMRELRVTQEMQPDGTKIAIRLPQQILVKRDFFVNKPETIS